MDVAKKKNFEPEGRQGPQSVYFTTSFNNFSFSGPPELLLCILDNFHSCKNVHTSHCEVLYSHCISDKEGLLREYHVDPD